MRSKNNHSELELDALIDACLDGRLSEEEADGLSKRLEESSEARERYWQLASVHGLLEQSMQCVSMRAATGEAFSAPVKAGRLSRWPRMAPIAAGIAIGIFSSSVVWAYKFPRADQLRREAREITFESFEDAELGLSGRFPSTANHWHGRVISVPGAHGMPAVSGNRIGQFLSRGDSKFTYARYLIDLDEYREATEGRVRAVEVEASFFFSNPSKPAVFQIRLAAFSQEPEAVRPIWNNEETLFDTVLQHVRRNHRIEAGEQPGWHELGATIEVPSGTRTILVSLGAGNVDSGGTPSSDHFVDAVRVTLVDTTAPLD